MAESLRKRPRPADPKRGLVRINRRWTRAAGPGAFLPGTAGAMSSEETAAPASSVQSLTVISSAPGPWRSWTHAPYGRHPAPRRSSSVPSRSVAVTPGSLRGPLAPSPLGAGGRARLDHESQVYRALDSAGAVRSRFGFGLSRRLQRRPWPRSDSARWRGEAFEFSSKRPTAGRRSSPIVPALPRRPLGGAANRNHERRPYGAGEPRAP